VANKTAFDLEVIKHTDNKVVFAEKLADSPLATRRITGLYVDKRDLRDMGWTGDSAKLTIEVS